MPPFLVADVGGTNARFALADDRGFGDVTTFATDQRPQIRLTHFSSIGIYSTESETLRRTFLYHCWELVREAYSQSAHTRHGCLISMPSVG